MPVIAYLVYGSRREYQLELSYSILSALRYLRRSTRGIRIALVAEESNARADLPVEHVFFTEDEFSAWTDRGAYPHQAQHRALAKVLDHFGGKVALVDTDTYFTAHPAKLFQKVGPGRSLMHADEGPVGRQPIWKPVFESIGRCTDVAGYRVSFAQAMYNAGVIGLDRHDRALLDDVDALARSLYAIRPVFNAEQFALGTVFEARTRLSVCPQMVKHYWGFEREFIHAQTERLFHEETAAHLERLSGAARLPKVGFPSKSVADRLAARLRARLRGAGKLYGFAYLAYRSALTSAARDPVYADIWARVALDALRLHRRGVVERALGTDRMRRDFRAFCDGAIERLWWVTSETKRRWQEFWAGAVEAA